MLLCATRSHIIGWQFGWQRPYQGILEPPGPRLSVPAKVNPAERPAGRCITIADRASLRFEKIPPLHVTGGPRRLRWEPLVFQHLQRVSRELLVRQACGTARFEFTVLRALPLLDLHDDLFRLVSLPLKRPSSVKTRSFGGCGHLPTSPPCGAARRANHST